MNLKTFQNFFLMMMMLEIWNQPNPFFSGFYDIFHKLHYTTIHLAKLFWMLVCLCPISDYQIAIYELITLKSPLFTSNYHGQALKYLAVM